MLSEKLTKALNGQINKEMASAYLYLGMATHFEAEGLLGFSAWMHKQVKEEMDHAMKIYKFIFETGGKPELEKLEAPKTEYGKPEDVIKQVLEHEKSVTESVNALYALASAENDYKTQVFLQWFITEQVEEEANVQSVLDKFKFVDGSAALLFLDKELGYRE
ncbi:ferritin [Treponema pedis]|uniref:Ferritin n=1 Tax=Treponema pedis TaxID=409322 RepID=A0A7S7AW18_9SPIR|nr:ferritin [Treponema pedis]QOW60815.1 ferritin [Treponema pedis]